MDTTNDLVQTGLQISPYNAYAFGALVVVLAVAVVFLWRAYDAKSKKLIEVLETSMTITAKVEQRLQEQSQHDLLLQEVKFELTRLRDFIKSNITKKNE